ncbi:MAG: hypothetical protein EOO14_02745 [Chitinophagaceae bacterium]|nr:MAG: hypothetical protein EOO14_02745 [Chitinophagaceae bacterium]
MRKIALLAFATAALLFGCKKDDLSKSKDPQLIISSDAAQLSQRLQLASAGVIGMNTNIAGIQNTGTEGSQYLMELLGSVQAPVYGSRTLKATHVEIDGSYAYVSYNTEGETYLGGIDIFNIASVSNPQLVSSVIIPDTDINSLYFSDNRLYFAGATDIYKLAGITDPAMVGWIELSGGKPTGKTKYAYLPGQVTTGITVANNAVFATTGASGYFLSLDRDSLRQINSIASPDLRGVAAYNDRIAVLGGNSGIGIYNAANFSLNRTIALTADVPEAKRTIEFNKNFLLVAGGKEGILYFNSDNGAKAGEIKLPAPTAGVSADDVVTNAVSNNNGLFFAANGAAGTYVCKANADNTLQLLGSINLDGSANYVKSKDNYLFVASGKGGLQIVKFTPPTTNTACNGLPAYTGGSNLNVNSNENLRYSGSVALQNVNVNASLFFCGNMTVSDNLNINSNGKMEVRGTLAAGAAGRSLNINSNATLKIEGDLVVYGDLRLNSGATLEFTGTNSSVTVYGNVYIDRTNAIVKGSFTDVKNKFK